MSLLNLLVYLVDYHFQLIVVPHLFEAAKFLRLKIEYSLKDFNVHSNCCYGFEKLNFGFIFQKFMLDVTEHSNRTVAAALNQENSDICSLVDISSSFWAFLGKFRTAYCLVTMVTQNQRLLFFEILWLEVLKYAFRAKSEKSWKWLWYALSKNWS